MSDDVYVLVYNDPKVSYVGLDVFRSYDSALAAFTAGFFNGE